MRQGKLETINQKCDYNNKQMKKIKRIEKLV
jgi:hypothetical protein